MHCLQIIGAIIGRLCLSAIFIIAGLNKVLNWDSSEQTLMNMLAMWSGYATTSWMTEVIKMMVEHIGWFLCAATVCELLGGILVLFGIGARFGALLLILFLLPTTVIFHAFWELKPPERDIQTVMFMKNMAILGGLFVVLAFGSGFGRKRITHSSDEH